MIVFKKFNPNDNIETIVTIGKVIIAHIHRNTFQDEETNQKETVYVSTCGFGPSPHSNFFDTYDQAVTHLLNQFEVTAGEVTFL